MDEDIIYDIEEEKAKYPGCFIEILDGEVYLYFEDEEKNFCVNIYPFERIKQYREERGSWLSQLLPLL